MSLLASVRQWQLDDRSETVCRRILLCKCWHLLFLAIQGAKLGHKDISVTARECHRLKTCKKIWVTGALLMKQRCEERRWEGEGALTHSPEVGVGILLFLAIKVIKLGHKGILRAARKCNRPKTSKK